MTKPRDTVIHFEEPIYLEAKSRAAIERKTLSQIVNESLRSQFGVELHTKWDPKKFAKAAYCERERQKEEKRVVR